MSQSKVNWEKEYREIYGEVFSETWRKYLTSYKTNPVSEKQFTYFFRWILGELRSQFGEMTAHEIVQYGLEKTDYKIGGDDWREDVDPQYSQVCDSPDCDQILHQDISIFCWEKESTGEELTVCESCHQDMSSWRADGWVEQGDEDEINHLLELYLAKCDGNNVSPTDLQDYLKLEGFYLTYRQCCYLLGDSEEDVNEYMLSIGRCKSANEVDGDE